MQQTIVCDLCGKTGFKTTQALHGHKSMVHGDSFDRSWKIAVGTSMFSGYEVLAVISVLEHAIEKCNPKKEVDKINFLKNMVTKLQDVTLGQKPVNFKVDF